MHAECLCWVLLSLSPAALQGSGKEREAEHREPSVVWRAECREKPSRVKEMLIRVRLQLSTGVQCVEGPGNGQSRGSQSGAGLWQIHNMTCAIVWDCNLPMIGRDPRTGLPVLASLPF